MSQSSAYGIPISTNTTLSEDSNFLVPSQKAVKTYVDTEIGGVVPKNLSGNAVIKTNGNSVIFDAEGNVCRLILNSTNATDPKILSFRTANLQRWAFRVDGANDNIYLRRYDDTGAYVETPIEVHRSNGNIYFNELTASQILSLDSNKKVTSLDTATYPSLTELAYVKGVTSAIQTQINSAVTSAYDRKIDGFQNTTSTVTGSTNETVACNLLIPASSMGANGVIDIRSLISKATVGTGTVTARMYLSTVATNTVGNTGTPTSSTLIGTVTSGTQANVYLPFTRTFANKNSESLNETLLTSANSSSNDTVIVASAFTTLNINTAVALYLVITLQLSSGVDTTSLRNVQYYINRV